MGEFAQMIKTDYDIEKMPITTQNPQANSMIERVHQTIGNIIRTFEFNKTEVNEEDPWAGILAATMYKLT